MHQQEHHPVDILYRPWYFLTLLLCSNLSCKNSSCCIRSCGGTCSNSPAAKQNLQGHLWQQPAAKQHLQQQEQQLQVDLPPEALQDLLLSPLLNYQLVLQQQQQQQQQFAKLHGNITQYVVRMQLQPLHSSLSWLADVSAVHEGFDDTDDVEFCSAKQLQELFHATVSFELAQVEGSDANQIHIVRSWKRSKHVLL